MTGPAATGNATLRVRTRAFIRAVVMPAEPAPGEALSRERRLALQVEARAAGVFAPHVSAEFGGQGLALEDWSEVFQEAGYSPIGPAVLNCMAPDEGNMHMLDLIATEQQKERFLAPLAAGLTRSSFAMTEPHPGAGSDPAALATTATRVDGGWLITGWKRFISGAEEAGFAIVMARNDASAGVAEGATMLLTPLDAPGIEIGPSVHTAESAITGGHPYIRFTDCFVADDAVLGTAGEGFRHAQLRLAPARLTHCMRWLGLARRANDTALDRAGARELFGARLSELGIAQAMLADSQIDIETSAAVIDRAVRALAADPRAGSALSSVAKVHCSEAVFRIIDRAVQLCGGDGVTHALPLLSYLNEVRPFRIYDGSNETHRWAIARRAVAARRRTAESGVPRLDTVDVDAGSVNTAGGHTAATAEATA